MEQQTVEIKFQGEQVGSHTDKDATYTLYSVPDSEPDDLYVVHVDKGDESWLETNGGKGLSEGMLATFFPHLAEAFVGDQASPHKFRPASLISSPASRQGSFRPRRRSARQPATSSSAS
jgi:hypothetical protein